MANSRKLHWKKTGWQFCHPVLLLKSQDHIIAKLNIQPIAHPSNRVQEFGVVGVELDRFSQPGDVYVQRARIAGVIGIPDALEECFTFDNLAAMFNQQLQQ